jgi:hypothetical protein
VLDEMSITAYVITVAVRIEYRYQMEALFLQDS